MTTTAFAIWLLLSMSSGAGNLPRAAGPLRIEGQHWTQRACETERAEFVRRGGNAEMLFCHRVVVEPKP